MQLPPLLAGTLIKRYKRFLADIKLDTQEIITAHCPNSGSLTGLANEGVKVYVSKNMNPKNKLAYKLELIETSKQALVDINTSRTNHLVKEALTLKQIPELAQYNTIKPETKFLNSRLDFQLSNTKRSCVVEVKSVTLQRNPLIAEFPDAITTRGIKHLQDLITIKQSGIHAVNLYIIQRNDEHKFFRIAKDIDKNYFNTFMQAKECGVELLCYTCDVSTTKITIKHKVQISYGDTNKTLL